MRVHTVFSDLFQTTTLRSHSRNQQEVIRNDLTDTAQHFRFRGSHDIHHVLVIPPLVRFTQNPFIQFHAILLKELEIKSTFIRGQCQQDHPFALIFQERGHGILTHIWSHRDRIKFHCLQECTGVHLGCIPDVPAFSIGNQEDFGIF